MDGQLDIAIVKAYWPSIRNNLGLKKIFLYKEKNREYLASYSFLKNTARNLTIL